MSALQRNELARILEAYMAGGQIEPYGADADGMGAPMPGQPPMAPPQGIPMLEAPPQQNLAARLASAPQYAQTEQERFATMPPEDRAVAQLPMGSMRNEQTGKVTYFAPGGGDGFGDRPYPEEGGRGAPPAQQRIKVAGFGDGIMSDLGETTGPAPQLDYQRGSVDVPGKGRGWYGKDGAVYLKGPEGFTKVMLGYDRQASQARAAEDLKRRRGEADIAQSQASTEHTQETTEALRASRTLKEDPNTQAALVKRFGPAEKGRMWRADGSLVPIPGGEVAQELTGKLDSAQVALDNIDELLKHPGFQATVGATLMPGARFVHGTDAADFTTRLDQLKGGAFLQAFNSLRGGGAITEIEGKKATDAITRMNISQSEKEFTAAANEFRRVISDGMAKARSAGGVPTAQATSQNAGVRAAPAQVLGPSERAKAVFQAKDAIRRGKDPAAVRALLEKNGITDHGI